MYKIKTDITKNRMLVTLSGILTYNEALACKDEIADELLKLSPKFDVINDFSQMHLAQEGPHHLLREILNYFYIARVNRIVGIVGSSEKALLQFAKLIPETNRIKIKYVPALEDAEEYLRKK